MLTPPPFEDTLTIEEDVPLTKPVEQQTSAEGEAVEQNHAGDQGRKNKWERNDKRGKQRSNGGQQQPQQAAPQQHAQYEPLPEDAPPLYLKKLEHVSIKDLVAMLPPDRAEDAINLRRHEVIMELIRTYLRRRGTVIATGTLESLSEGFGFLRSAANNYLQ
jgi:transcription termination factor Rho